MITIRIRSMVWFVTGAMLAAAVLVVFAHAWRVDAAPGDTDTTFVPLAAPCRLMDTRLDTRVGVNGTFSAKDTKTLQATGINGQCNIPAEAVGLTLNVTAVNATANTFLTVWPGGTLPKVSNLNPAPGQPPTPNAVNVALSGSGSFNIYNLAGTVEVIVDINGYFTRSSLQELANRISALEASQPFTVTSPQANSVTAQSTPTSIRRVTLTAPVAGHVAVMAAGTASTFGDFQSARCGLMDTLAAPPAGVEQQWESAMGGGSAVISSTRVFTIAAGATATYYFVCSNPGGTGIVIQSPVVTAIFTPA